jgi:DNA-binding response OmpR family regulator
MISKALSGSSILIVEDSTLAACDLRSAFQKLSAKVHVVSNVNAALTVARSKRLSGAIIDRSCVHAALPLCAELASGQVPYIFHEEPGSTNVVDDMMRLMANTRSSQDFAEAS